MHWDSHPLLAAAAPVQQTLSAYVRFKMWDITAGQFQPLPANVAVKLVDDSQGTSQTLLTQLTDATGLAIFNIPNPIPEFPSIFFVVDTGSIPTPFASQPALPAQWSTRSWHASDGLTPGYKTAFTGGSFGTAANPVEFEVGTRFIIRVRYEDVGDFYTTGASRYLNLPRYTKITFAAANTTITATVNQDGVAEWFTVAIDPQSNPTLRIECRSQGTATDFPYLDDVIAKKWINIGSSPIEITLSSAVTKFSGLDKTSIGTEAAPFTIDLKHDGPTSEFCGAFTCFRAMTELNVFVRSLVETSADWDNFSNQKINLRALLLGGLSWPVGIINFPKNFENWRDGQIHEFSHQLLWRWGGYTTLEIGFEYCNGDGWFNHQFHWYTNGVTALTEGWATFFEFLAFTNYVDVVSGNGDFQLRIGAVAPHAYPPLTVKHPYGILQSQHWARNWGEEVEGAFAGGLLMMYRLYVLAPLNMQVTPPSLIPSTTDGNILTQPGMSWLTDTATDAVTARQRFQNTIIKPAKRMASIAHAKATDFIDAIRNLNASDWDDIRPILQDFYMAFPEIEEIAPSTAAAAGGTQVVLTGRHFVQASSQVFFENNPATSVTVSADEKSIVCTAPAGNAGTKVSIKIVTPDGDHSVPDAVKYV